MVQWNPNEKKDTMPKREMCLVVDVETCGGFSSPLVYDIGLAVVERTTGRIVDSWSLIVKEVFYGKSSQMSSAYYAEKIPTYHRDIADGVHYVAGLWQIWRLIRNLQDKYGIRKVYAYNAKFDRDALDNTFRNLTNGGRHFFPRNMEWCCIWHMACQTILSQKKYRKFAQANGLVSDAGNLRTSAEAAYAYITNTPGYEEPHTGLADVEIETAILHKVLRQKKAAKENITHDPWRIPQTV